MHPFALSKADDPVTAIAAHAFAEARPLARNAFKIELAQRAALRALQAAGERT